MFQLKPPETLQRRSSFTKSRNNRDLVGESLLFPSFLHQNNETGKKALNTKNILRLRISIGTRSTQAVNIRAMSRMKKFLNPVTVSPTRPHEGIQGYTWCATTSRVVTLISHLLMREPLKSRDLSGGLVASIQVSRAMSMIKDAALIKHCFKNL